MTEPDPGKDYAEPHRGMPPLDPSGPPVSYFEFWPQYRFYAPMVLYWGWLSLRYGGMTLPSIANPLFPNGGWIGESKAKVMGLFGPYARSLLSPWTLAPGRSPHEAPETAAAKALEQAAMAGLALPLVAKPDMGMRGAGVRVIREPAHLAAYYAKFPPGEPFILQRLVAKEGEAGVFYVRKPSERRGQIISLTLKYFPYVTGDGVSTLAQLIESDPRAGLLKHIYLPRHAHRLDMVLEKGEPFRIAFAGSHSRGAIFRDGGAHVTPQMTAAFDAIADDVPEFYFGRFDIRFDDFEQVKNGTGFTIIELNGAGAEATHVWDRNMTLRAAYGALMRQYRLMWEIGRENQLRGFEPIKILDILAANERERALAMSYPLTE